MMRRILTLLLLLACAGPVLADPPPTTLQIQDVTFTGGTFYFDLVVTDVGSATASDILGIAMGATLSGSGTSHLTVTLPAMQKSGPAWATAMAPRIYTWASISTANNAGNDSGLVTGLTTFVLVDDNALLGGTSVGLGTVAGRFVFGWDGTVLAPGTLTIHVSGDTGVAQPYFIGGPSTGYQSISADVENNDLEVPEIPEPATLGLLGLGLAGLAARRRRSR